MVVRRAVQLARLRPKLGTSPSATVPSPPPLWIPAPYRGTGPAFDRRNDEGMPRMTNERLLERSDRSPGHAFIAIAHVAPGH